MLRVPFVFAVIAGSFILDVGAPRAAALAGEAWQQSAITDTRVQANPLLTALAKDAPTALPEYLRELDQITSVSQPGLIFRGPQPARPSPTPEEAKQIGANPDIALAYKLNPDPMLELLRRMMAAVQKAK